MNPEPIKDDDVFSASEVARLLSVSVQAVTKRIKRGSVTGVKRGNKYEITGQEVNRLLNREPRPLNPEGVNPEPRFTEPKPDRVQGVDPTVDAEMERLRAALVSAEQQVEVYGVKVEAAERESEAMRGERETLRGEVDHLRGLTVLQAESVQNLTEEIKGLTVALHRAQEHMQIAVAPAEEPEVMVRRSRWYSRMFRRRRIVRIGHA